jgi:hypothetical protein
MATLDEHAYNIRNIARNGYGSDDDRLNISQIKFWIQAYRAKAIFEYTNAGKDIDPQLIQDLGVLTLTEVDKSDSNCPPDIDWGCTIKKVELPKFVDLPYNRGLMFVGYINKQTLIIIDRADVHEFKRATRFGKLFTRGYLIGSTLYIVAKDDDDEMNYINVRGVFEDPTKVSRFDAECNEICFDEANDQYPLPMRLYDFIVANIIQKELGLTLQTPNDEMNDARQANAGIGQ